MLDSDDKLENKLSLTTAKDFLVKRLTLRNLTRRERESPAGRIGEFESTSLEQFHSGDRRR